MQTKKGSLFEQLLNVGSGFIISLMFWAYVIVPVWHIDVSINDNLAITGLFTIISIIRGYIWRRIFNRIT